MLEKKFPKYFLWGGLIMIKPVFLYLNDLYDENIEDKKECLVEEDIERIEIKGISFKYKGTVKQILNNVFLKLKKDKKFQLCH